MVTGKKAFEGKSHASLIGAIMSSEPPAMSLQPLTPLALNRVVKRCLAKDPDERWQSANDLTDQLRWISESGSQAGAAIAVASPARKNWLKRLAWAAAGLVACAIVGIAVWILKPASPAPVMRFAMSGNLMAVPFDAQRLTVTGAAVPVVEGVLPFQYSFSATASLVYVPGAVQAAQLKLVWVDRRGAEQPLPAPTHTYVLPRISPDGQRVAAGIEEAESQIWLYDLARDTLTRLTFEGNANIDPIWTPDGKRIVFKDTRNRLLSGTRNVWILQLKDRKAQSFVTTSL